MEMRYAFDVLYFGNLVVVVAVAVVIIVVIDKEVNLPDTVLL